jgi:hypothetical protein
VALKKTRKFCLTPTKIPLSFTVDLPNAVLKYKAIPLQALTSLEGSRRLNLPDLKTVCT